MQELIDLNLVAETRDVQNLSYIFEREDFFSLTGYKVLRNYQESALIPCFKVQYNGKIKLVYDLTKFHSLQMILPLLKPEKFISIILDLLNNISTITSNGFIQINKVAFTLDKIFIDDKDKIALIYLPYNDISNQYNSQLYEESVKQMIKEAISLYKNLNSSEMLRLYDDIKEKNFSLENIKYYISEGRYNKQDITNAEQIIVEKQNDLEISSVDTNVSEVNNIVRMIQPNAKLVGLGLAQSMEFIINKSELIFGKNKEAVDISLSFHPAISRVHCKIMIKNDKYYVSDLGSANGTYLNGIKLKSFEVSPLELNDEIRLANISFVLKKIK